MKLTELEDYDRLQNDFDRLRNAIDKLENKLDSRFNQLDRRISRVQYTVWLAIAASVAQIVAVLFHR